MTAPERALVDEAFEIIDGTSPLLATGAHLVALHEYWKTVRDDLLGKALDDMNRQHERIVELLRKLDAEHSHLISPCTGECPVCAFLAAQPEWPQVREQRERERA